MIKTNKHLRTIRLTVRLSHLLSLYAPSTWARIRMLTILSRNIESQLWVFTRKMSSRVVGGIYINIHFSESSPS